MTLFIRKKEHFFNQKILHINIMQKNKPEKTKSAQKVLKCADK
jgi:hypothetical protein